VFRELGELLVGRDSTALVELIKNSYDADAITVIVEAEGLADVEKGHVRIADDGIGMSPAQFESGFLTIASRAKDTADRKSSEFARRFTGAKGIGRLAAHKLARVVQIDSVSQDKGTGSLTRVTASIDWDKVELQKTLDEIEGSGAIQVQSETLDSSSSTTGTVITLRRLRRPWTPAERSRFLAEVETFEAPAALTRPLPKTVVTDAMLFTSARIRDTSNKDPGCAIRLEGEFSTGEDYWRNLVEASAWVIEIVSKEGDTVKFAISPTERTVRENPGARRRELSVRHPSADIGPFFEARILVREGQVSQGFRAWANRMAGVRVFMEGFRVLPYGEPKNDWLGLDSDYSRRTRALAWLGDEFSDATQDKDEGLLLLPNSSYYGGVFLTERGAKTLRMLVNREGFVPEAGFDTIVQLVRTGIDFCTRVRAASRVASRVERRTERAQKASQGDVARPAVGPRRELEAAIAKATTFVGGAREDIAAGKVEAAADKVSSAVVAFAAAIQASDRLISQGAMVQVLASVGTQMASFIHEINGLLGMAQSVDAALTRIRQDPALSPSVRAELGKLHSAISDLKRRIERQSAYLVDVITPDARRRRSRQSLRERFEAGRRLVEFQAAAKAIESGWQDPSSWRNQQSARPVNSREYGGPCRSRRRRALVSTVRVNYYRYRPCFGTGHGTWPNDYEEYVGGVRG